MKTKQHILALLENNRGQSISGEQIAGKLGLSRNAVWKAIKELRSDGYKIEAVTNKGYCLCADNDILSVQGILPFLKDKDVGENIMIFETLESTNKTAKELSISGAKHGTVVLARSQTAGRGRYARQFHSPPGGIYLSFILHPDRLSLETPTLITAIAAVAVCRAVETVATDSPRIKWVNDIFSNGKKICGILTEAVTDFESGNIQWVVVGIGVNFNTKRQDIPKDLRGIIGSIFAEGNPIVTRNQLVGEIINQVLCGTTYGREQILCEYKKRLMMLGEQITVVSKKETYRATAMDIDGSGHLIVKKENDEICTLSGGEISIKGKTLSS